MRRILIWLLATAGCGATTHGAPPSILDGQAAPKATASAIESASPEPQSKPSFAGYSLVFKQKVEKGTIHLLIAPWGDVIAVGGTRGVVLARDTGKELLSFDTCFTTAPEGAGFVDDHHLVIACDDEADEISFPSGKSTKVLSYLARTAAVGGGHVVTAGGVNLQPNDVTVYDARDFHVVDKVDGGDAVNRLILSPDGKLIAAEESKQGIVLREIGKKTSRGLMSNRSAHALRFSPDGARLLAMVGPTESDEIDVATGKSLGSFKTPSDITGVRYVEGGVLISGIGLTLFSSTGVATPAPIEGLGGALGVSADGGYVCNAGATDSDVIWCFSKKPVAPSTFVANGPGSEGTTGP